MKFFQSHRILALTTLCFALVFSVLFFFVASDSYAQSSAAQICETDAQCGGGGRTCVKDSSGIGRCSAATQKGASCSDDSGCTGGLKCVSGTCQTPSSSSSSSSSSSGNTKVTTLQNPIAAQNIGSLLTTIINYVLGFIAVIAAAILVYGGIMYMTSAGNDDQLKSAKSIITSGIIGLILSLASGIIVQLVISAVGG